MRRHWAYLKAVTRHKWFVFLACLQWGVPIWSAILHDWDKFLPDEWLSYAACFYAPNGSPQYVETDAFNVAWLKHQNRNKHHWQYWVLMEDSGNVIPMNLPDSARREMLADWYGAGRAYNANWTPLEPRQWYEKNKDKMQLNPETREWVETQLLHREQEYLTDLRRRSMLGI